MPIPDTTKDVLRLFSYGLYVAAAIGADGPRAATVSWVTQVSFDPRLLAVAMRKDSSICETVRASRRFTLHVVGADQTDFARAFFRFSQAGPEDIAGYHYTVGPTRAPVFDHAIAWLACEVVEEANASGDHALFIAQIVGSGQRVPGAAALTLRDTPWRYGG
ncbi:MAG: flavin reductase [Chloroflexi bacterium]|nr:flavin reductase [Chloroflexota bacterium]